MGAALRRPERASAAAIEAGSRHAAQRGLRGRSASRGAAAQAPALEPGPGADLGPAGAAPPPGRARSPQCRLGRRRAHLRAGAPAAIARQPRWPGAAAERQRGARRGGGAGRAEMADHAARRPGQQGPGRRAPLQG